jgi:hypothetical protein
LAEVVVAVKVAHQAVMAFLADQVEDQEIIKQDLLDQAELLVRVTLVVLLLELLVITLKLLAVVALAHRVEIMLVLELKLLALVEMVQLLALLDLL